MNREQINQVEYVLERIGSGSKGIAPSNYEIMQALGMDAVEFNNLIQKVGKPLIQVRLQKAKKIIAKEEQTDAMGLRKLTDEELLKEFDPLSAELWKYSDFRACLYNEPYTDLTDVVKKLRRINRELRNRLAEHEHT